MKSNLRIASELIRVARLLLASNRRARRMRKAYGSYSLSQINDPSLSDDIMRKMAICDDVEVRCGIAKRNDIPVDLMRSFMNDKDWPVRAALARSEAKLPVDIIKTLAHDRMPEVREIVAKREDLPDDLIIEMANNNNNDDMYLKGVRKSLGERKTLPEEAIRILSDKKDLDDILLMRKDLPDDVAKKLKKRDDKRMRKMERERRMFDSFYDYDFEDDL